jgi:hypothetical protein
MKITRVVAMLAGAALATGGFVATAAAAGPPSNDRIAGATVVASLPFTATVDTTAATTDADDVQVNGTCGAPNTNNSVWYTFTAGPSDTVLAVDTTGSNFSSGVIIATGTPGALTTQACGPVSTFAPVSPGTKYYILAFDDTGSGGTLHIAFHGPGPKPKNDTANQATVVSALPFADTLDTTGATTDAIDTQANQTCGAPATGNSVWYKFTAGASDGAIFVDASFSDYFAGVLVATGTPGALTTVTCGPLSVTTPTTPGTTYYIMVFDAVGGGGGTLRLNIDHAPSATVRLHTKTFVDSQHDAQLTGSYSCTNASYLDIHGGLLEIVGKNVAIGSFDNLGVPAPKCDGKNHSWSAEAASASVAFAQGKAAVFLFNLACSNVVCTQGSTGQVLKLVTSAPAASAFAPTTSSSVHVFRRSSRPIYGTAVHSTTATWGH